VSASQSVAPQGAVVRAQAAEQQCPTPLMPQRAEVQSSFSVQGPTGMGATQAPALHTKPVAHSALEVQVVPHWPLLAHRKLPGQGAEVTGVQAPAPLQVFW
jgi:hypothetical protein